MNRNDRFIRRARVLATVAFTMLALMVLATPSAAVRTCKDCVQSENDTSFTPGIVGIPRMAVRYAADPAISFVGKDRLLRCAVAAPPTWRIEIADPASHAGGCSMDLDETGEPMIGYHDSNGMLLLARRSAGGWSRELVDPLGTVGGLTSLARFPGGIGIAFEDTATGRICYAERMGMGPWITEIVSLATEQAEGPSLVVDGDLRAIAYHDRVAGDLRIAIRPPGASWTTSLVDGPGDVGGYASMVGAPSLGGFGIAYYDFTNADLKYAFGMPGNWTIETVDGNGSRVGRFCSIAGMIGSSGDNVQIGYYDQDRGDLKVAVRHGSWIVGVRDSAGNVGGSVACGGTGHSPDTLGVAYVHRTEHDLLYQWTAGGVTAVSDPVAGNTPLSIQWLRSARGGEGRVRFTVPVAGSVRVRLYDTGGRVIASPLSQPMPAGRAEVAWDGRDRSGRPVRAGVFFVRVETMGGACAISAVLLR